MSKLMKEITVVFPEKMKNDNRFAGKSFRSFKAIALLMVRDETLTVEVKEYFAGPDPLKISAGYGQIQRNQNSFLAPKRLGMEY